MLEKAKEIYLQTGSQNSETNEDSANTTFEEGATDNNPADNSRNSILRRQSMFMELGSKLIGSILGAIAGMSVEYASRPAHMSI